MKKTYNKYHIRIWNNIITNIFSFISGSPAPTVTWSNNGQILSSQLLDFSFPSTLNSKLVVKNLSRIHQHAVYTCQASNFHKKSVTANVTIELLSKYENSW